MPSPAWYNNSWSKRILITPSSTTPDALFYELANAPAAFWDNVRSDGGDIRITKSDGTTEVAREISGFDFSGKKGQLWIATSSATAFYLYYGNASATEPLASDTYGKEAVWPTNKFVCVLHLNESSGKTLADSTANHLDGTSLLPTNDQAQSQENAGINVGKSTTFQKVAQSFVPGVAHYDFLRFRRRGDLGTFTGTVTVSIVEDNADTPTGSVVFTKTYTNDEWKALSTSAPSNQTFTTILFDLNVTIGNKYWIKFETSTLDNSNCATVGVYNTSSQYASGTCKKSDNGTSWTDLGYDMTFAVGTLGINSVSDGKIGRAVRFTTATNAAIFVPDPNGKSNFDTPDSYSISFLVRRHDATSLSDRSCTEHWEPVKTGVINPYPWASRGFTTSPQVSCGVYNGGTGAPSGVTYNPGMPSTTALSANTWGKVCFVKDRANLKLRTIQNGTEVGTGNTDTIPSGDSTKSATNGFVLGERTSNGISRTPNIDLQEFRIRIGVLTAAVETAENNNYNSPSTFWTTGSIETKSTSTIQRDSGFGIRTTSIAPKSSSFGIRRTEQVQMASSFGIHRTLQLSFDAAFAVLRVLQILKDSAFTIGRSIGIQKGSSFSILNADRITKFSGFAIKRYPFKQRANPLSARSGIFTPKNRIINPLPPFDENN